MCRRYKKKRLREGGVGPAILSPAGLGAIIYERQRRDKLIALTDLRGRDPC